MSASSLILAPKQLLGDGAALSRRLAAELRPGLAPAPRLLDDPPVAAPPPALLLARRAAQRTSLVVRGRSSQLPWPGPFPGPVLSAQPVAPRDPLVPLEFPCPPTRLCAEVQVRLPGEGKAGSRFPTG